MPTRHRISLFLLLCLMLGQVFSLTHGIEHTLSDPDHKACVLCLSSSHQYGLTHAASQPVATDRHAVPGFEPDGDLASYFHCGYASRAPPILLQSSA